MGEFIGGGRLAVHQLNGHAPGSIDLIVLVDDLDDAAAAVASVPDVTVERSELSGVGEMVVITASSGVAVTAFVRGGAEDVDGPVRQQPIWFQDDLGQARAILEALGLSVELQADSGRWIELRGSAGSVGLHHSQEPRLGPSFQSDDLVAVAAQVTAAGFTAALIDEAYGRSLRIDHPDGEVWVNETQRDLYGYSPGSD